MGCSEKMSDSFEPLFIAPHKDSEFPRIYNISVTMAVDGISETYMRSCFPDIMQKTPSTKNTDRRLLDRESSSTSCAQAIMHLFVVRYVILLTFLLLRMRACVRKLRSCGHDDIVYGHEADPNM